MAEQTKAPALPAGFVSVKSSNIEGVAWFGPAGEPLLEALTEAILVNASATTGKLAVAFKNGTRYDYQGVPAVIVEMLVNGPSVGKTFNSLIKGHEEFHGAKVDWATGANLQPTEAQS